MFESSLLNIMRCFWRNP